MVDMDGRSDCRVGGLGEITSTSSEVATARLDKSMQCPSKECMAKRKAAADKCKTACAIKNNRGPSHVIWVPEAEFSMLPPANKCCVEWLRTRNTERQPRGGRTYSLSCLP